MAHTCKRCTRTTEQTTFFRSARGEPLSLCVECMDADTREMCTCCGQCKPPSAFRPDPRKRNGLQSWCKDCERIRDRERYQRRKERCLWSRFTMYGVDLRTSY